MINKNRKKKKDKNKNENIIRFDLIPSENEQDYIRNVKFICLINGWDYDECVLNLKTETVDVKFLIGEDAIGLSFDISEIDFRANFNSKKVNELAKTSREIFLEEKAKPTF